MSGKHDALPPRDRHLPGGVTPAGAPRPEVEDGSEYEADEIEFMLAMEGWKTRTGKRFPTWCDVLGVLKSLGWRQE